MHFTPETEADFVTQFLHPALQLQNLTKGLVLMGFDHNRNGVSEWPLRLPNRTSSIIQGTAVHWYMDSITNASVLTDLHNAYPDKFILYTEVLL